MVNVAYRGKVINTEKLPYGGYKRLYLELLHDHKKHMGNCVNVCDLGEAWCPAIIFDKEKYEIKEQETCFVVYKKKK